MLFRSKRQNTSNLNTSDLKLKITYGYKATDKDMMCRNYQYTMEKIHTIEGEPELCSHGFHFCKKIEDVNNYYNLIDLDSNNRVFEICTRGNNLKTDAVKVTTDNIQFIRELSRAEIDNAFKISRQFDAQNNLVYFSNSDSKIINEYVYSNDNSIFEKKTVRYARPATRDRLGYRINVDNGTLEIVSIIIEKYDGDGNITFESLEYPERPYNYNDDLIKREISRKSFTFPDNSSINYINEIVELYRYDTRKTTKTEIDIDNKQFITTSIVADANGDNAKIAEVHIADVFNTDDKPYYQSVWKSFMPEGSKQECWSEYSEPSLLSKMIKINFCTYVYTKENSCRADHVIVESFKGDIIIENNHRSVVKYITSVDIDDLDMAEKIYNYISNLVKSISDNGIRIDNRIDLKELISNNLIKEFPFGFVKLSDHGKRISEILKMFE